MAVQIINQQDREMGVNSNGTASFTREVQFEGDTLMEIGTSPLLPQKWSRHPENVIFYLDSIQLKPNGNRERKVQALAVLTYNNSVENANLSLMAGEKEPWELGAQNLSATPQTIAKPLLSGINRAGKVIQNLNSAGCRIVAETTENIRVISFNYCVRYKNRDPLLNNNAIINKDVARVAGIDILPFTGKLLPMSATFVVEYKENSDKVKRRYWNVTAEIHVKGSGWSLKELNVGTMAFFKTSGEIVRKPRNIYRYTPWKSWDPEKNLTESTEFGSLEDVVAAKRKYAEAVMIHKTENDKWTFAKEKDIANLSFYNQAWNDLPFEEVTEPMPLKRDGTLYMEAINDPVNYPYLEIDIYDTVIGTWNRYDLPKERA